MRTCPTRGTTRHQRGAWRCGLATSPRQTRWRLRCGCPPRATRISLCPRANPLVKKTIQECVPCSSAPASPASVTRHPPEFAWGAFEVPLPLRPCPPDAGDAVTTVPVLVEYLNNAQLSACALLAVQRVCRFFPAPFSVSLPFPRGPPAPPSKTVWFPPATLSSRTRSLPR